MSGEFRVVVHHNPACGTSRNVLAIIEAAGYAPTVIEYLKTGWTRPQLLGLFAAAGLTPRTALRTTRSPAEELGLLAPEVSDESIIDAMLEHPVLVNRPIVCTPKGVRLCRPTELVLDLLDRPPPGAFRREDGATVRAAHASLAAALAKGPPPPGNLAVPVFTHGTLEVEMYSPVGEDRQTPHDRDEVYVVARGTASFFDGESRYPVEAGEFLFVAAGQPHRFESFSSDFAVWVIFYGPPGGESRG